MSVARFIADQRTKYRVPHTITCMLLGVSLSWVYKWLTRSPTPSEQRRGRVVAAVAAAFQVARGLHGSPAAARRSAPGRLERSRRRRWPTRCAASAWWRAGSAGVTD